MKDGFRVVLSPADAAALLFAFRNPGPQRLVKSAAKPGLFATKLGSAKLMALEPALLKAVGAESKTPLVELTPPGVQEAESALLIGYKNTPVEGRETFLDDLGPLRDSLEERILAEEATTAKAEREAYAAKYRAERDRHRAKRELAEETAAFHGQLEAEFETLLKKLTQAAPKVKRSSSEREATVEKFAEVKEGDRDFRKAVVREMAKAWFDLEKRGEVDAAYGLESMLRKIPDVERIGEVGEPVEFAPDLHEADAYIDKGTDVTIRFPGWLIRDRANDAVSVIQRAFVA